MTDLSHALLAVVSLIITTVLRIPSLPSNQKPPLSICNDGGYDQARSQLKALGFVAQSFQPGKITVFRLLYTRKEKFDQADSKVIHTKAYNRRYAEDREKIYESDMMVRYQNQSPRQVKSTLENKDRVWC